jgi:CrcB protein
MSGVDVEPQPVPDGPEPTGPAPFARNLRRRRGRGSADVLAVIALGGGLGSLARYGCGYAWPVRAGAFPWSTFVVNVTGCAVLGLLMVYVLEVWPPRRYIRPFLGVGVCGGFTTFSTYAIQTRDLAAAGHWSLADAYAIDTLLAALAAVLVGMVAGRLLAGRPLRGRTAGRMGATRATQTITPQEAPR